MDLLRVEENPPVIEKLELLLSENEKDKDGKVKLYSDKAVNKALRGQPKPNPITTGLTEFQVHKMKEAIFQVANIDCAYKFACAKILYELKGIIRGSKKGENPKQWTAFKKSGLVPFSPRDIQDLTTSYEWMRDSGVDGRILNTVGLRTLAIIANCQDRAAKARLTAALIAGEQVTQKRAMLEVYGPKVKEPDIQLEAFMSAEKEKVAKIGAVKLKDKYLALAEANFKLKEELKEAKRKLAEAA